MLLPVERTEPATAEIKSRRITCTRVFENLTGSDRRLGRQLHGRSGHNRAASSAAGVDRAPATAESLWRAVFFYPHRRIIGDESDFVHLQFNDKLSSAALVPVSRFVKPRVKLRQRF